MMYDCLIIGGGMAGLQAAIQLGRYSVHRILVVDAGKGRSTLCREYHNLLGFPDGISGEELRSRGRRQAESFGVEFAEDRIVQAEKAGEGFRFTGAAGRRYESRTVLLATGLLDRYPDIPGLETTFGRSVYVCPDCDGYEIQDRDTLVIGSGNPGADMALLMAERARSLIYINHEKTHVDEEKHRLMHQAGIRYMEQEVTEIIHENDGYIQGAMLEDGSLVEAERGFIAFGGNHVHSELAEQLGVELHHNRHVEANPRSKMTNVEHVWAAGDLGVHSELVTAAMGDGAIAAVWINKTLRKLKQEQTGS
ncbi:pyridine nucleotide-disulfide oxidoreductase [Paenibacillus yonginensis]|uniref:Pyridine nucleotide-disulfide oxidoreductase n=1 Tax=Paenibacillus yonginensis TaxID=1462996 RepID=A0A1B1MY98_9BACL|nr:NAD(P)/FAD-dependent oxidoreductase [Paenibacillus yonginensis]ANS74145.1 pyridine nucleotide-disulfide oxidoreductase [Paenibacillus yonginensis]